MVREEALSQVAVGKVQFQPLEPCGQCATCGGHKVGLHAGNVLQCHGLGYPGQTAAVSNGGRCYRLPGTRVVLGNVVIAFPGALGAGLAACVGDLDAGHGASGLDAGGDAAHAFDVLVVPKACAGRGDAAFGRYARGLDDHQACAAASETGVMRLVPFIGEAVHRAVLAHRRDRDTVAQGDAFELERCEQGRHAACFLVG
ncbi:hypothetical protein D3C71_1129060 [compost metagenome]